MTIQFNFPKQHVKEWVASYLMNKLMNLYALNKAINRAEVNLREEPTGEKHCDVSLTIPGDSLFASQKASSFEEASLLAMNAIELRLYEILNGNKFPLFRKLKSWRLKNFA